jgi:hypothetical protein
LIADLKDEFMSLLNDELRARPDLYMQNFGRSLSTAIAVVFGMALFAFAGAACAADRSRVKIQNNTVVADNGWLIRSYTTWIHDFAYGSWQNPGWWTDLRDRGHFNAVRVIAFLGSWPNSNQTMDVTILLSRLDVAVNNASAAGMYVVIDDHSSCCLQYNPTLSTQFWNAVAPRYANRTHVIYEHKNEPGPTDPDPTYLQFEINGYRQMRSLAPQTHLIMWTFWTTNGNLLRTMQAAGGNIDYSNASVGFHPYGYNESMVLAIKSQYPVICTEFSTCCGSPEPASFQARMEQLGISWMWLQGYSEQIGGTFAYAHYQVTWPLDPGTTTGWKRN